jgi:hypothetical protein
MDSIKKSETSWNTGKELLIKEQSSGSVPFVKMMHGVLGFLIISTVHKMIVWL